MLADRRLRTAAALTAVLALSACGETKRIVPSSHATPRAVPSVPATVFPAPTKSVAPSPTETGASPTATGPAEDPNTVLASAGNTFAPATMTVKAGTEVTWTAEGFHTVNSGTPADGVDAAGPMQSPQGFATYSVTFDKAGTYKYFCQPHASLNMVGEIVVT